MPRFGHTVGLAVGLVLALAAPRTAVAKAVMLSCPDPGAEPGAPNETWVLNVAPTDESVPEQAMADMELPDGGDCSAIEIVPGLACHENAITEWPAGVKGLCDAPYGLGIRKGESSWVLVARFKNGSPQNQLALVKHRTGCSGSQPSHSADVAPKHAPDLATAAEPAQPARYDVNLPSFACTPVVDLPGHLRRVDRPPRNTPA